MSKGITKEEFKAKAKAVIDTVQFGKLGVLFNYESFEEMKVAQIPDDLCSSEADMPLDDFLDKLYEQIKGNLPPVIPTRKKGKWIGHGEHCENLGVIPSGLGAYEWCSNCDCGIDVREWHRNHYNYCPNCGAEMESEE